MVAKVPTNTSRAANEVVNGNSMSGNNVVSLEDVCSVADDGRRRRARDRSSVLLAILTGCTLRKVGQLAGCGVKSATCFCLTQDSSSQQELDLLEPNVSEAIVPSQKFLFGFAEVVIRLVDLGDCCDECVSGLERILTIEGVGRRQVVLRIYENHYRSST